MQDQMLHTAGAVFFKNLQSPSDLKDGRDNSLQGDLST